LPSLTGSLRRILVASRHTEISVAAEELADETRKIFAGKEAAHSNF
jgi:hypothetical protein